MSYFTARFKGGPLAGEMHTVSSPMPRYRVNVVNPDRARVSMTDSGSLPKQPWHFDYEPIWDEEEYELDRFESNFNTFDLVYHWINPTHSLRKEIKRLKDELAQVTEQALRDEREWAIDREGSDAIIKSLENTIEYLSGKVENQRLELRRLNEELPELRCIRDAVLTLKEVL